VCLLAVVDGHYRTFSHHRAVEASMRCVRDANAFVQAHQPWLLARSRDPRDVGVLQCILHVGLETARVVALALSPVTPTLSGRLLDRLGCDWLNEAPSRHHMTSSLQCGPMAGARPLGPDNGPLLTRRSVTR